MLQKVVQMAGLDIWRGTVQLLGYTDDLDVVGRTERDVAMALGRIEEECHPAGLKLSVEKTEVMKTTRHPEGRRALNLGEHEYEVVQNFVCLGSSVNAECSETGEIKRRITTSYFALSSILTAVVSHGPPNSECTSPSLDL